jgi:hypothetical protein
MPEIHIHGKAKRSYKVKKAVVKEFIELKQKLKKKKTMEKEKKQRKITAAFNSNKYQSGHLDMIEEHSSD